MQQSEFLILLHSDDFVSGFPPPNRPFLTWSGSSAWSTSQMSELYMCMFSSSSLSLPPQIGRASLQKLRCSSCLSPPILPLLEKKTLRYVSLLHSRRQVSLKNACLRVLCAAEDICKLYCIAEDFDFFFAMSSKVKDGTPCSKTDVNVCIEGVCEVRRLPLSIDSGLKMFRCDPSRQKTCVMSKKKLIRNVRRGTFFIESYFATGSKQTFSSNAMHGYL